MLNLRSFPIQGDDIVSGHLANVGRMINQHNLHEGDNVRIEQSTTGKTIHVDLPSNATTIMNYRGMFDENLSYSPNDVVYSFGGTSSFDGGDISIGTFVCTAYVPASASNAAFFLNNIVPMMGTNATDQFANCFRWTPIISYYPISSSLANNTGSNAITQISGFNIFIGLNYWNQLGGALSTSSFCGEWDPNRTYVAQQQTIISFGSNAGTYVYVSAMPTSGNPPWQGNNYWVQLPMGQLGQFI